MYNHVHYCITIYYTGFNFTNIKKLTMQFHDCHTLFQLIAATVYYIRSPLSWHIPEKYLYKDSHMETK